jgi:hypothetical protein
MYHVAAMNPPRRISVARLWPAAALVALLVPLFVMVPPHLRHDPVIGPLGDRYHVGLFTVLVLLLHGRGPLAGRLRAVVTAAVLLGGATELAQLLAGRSAALVDWYQDVLGTALGAAWVWWRRTPRAPGPYVLALAALALVAWPLRELPRTAAEAHDARLRFPLLDDFERPGALLLWDAVDDAELALTDVPGRGRVLRITATADSRWPGAGSMKLPYDWSGMTTLTLDCRAAEAPGDTLALTVRLHDRAGRYDRDRADARFKVGPSWQTIRIALPDLLVEDGRRPVNTAEVEDLKLFLTTRTVGAVTVDIDNVLLSAH